MKQQEIQITRIVSAPLEENAYIARLEGRNDCLVVDPGLEPERIIEYLEQESLTLAAILNTHGHFDHIAGNRALKERWPECRLIIGSGDAGKLADPDANLSAGFGLAGTSPAANVLVKEGEAISEAGIELEVLEIPGHSAGHVVFLCRQQDPILVFVGDVIFADSIGRADFPDSNPRQLTTGIRTKLFTLPDSTVLLPGHGPTTTVGREKKHNPFVGEAAIMG